MKRNKRKKRYSQFTLNTMNLAVLMVTGVIVLMGYCWFDSRCGAIAQEIADSERRLSQLDGELERETMRWNEMTTPEKLEAALAKHGLDMHLPQPDQVINVKHDGRISPRQMSVVRAKRRNGGDISRTAQGVSPRRAITSRRSSGKAIR